jgi:hypothetical protein
MAKNKISEYSATAANNTDIGGIDIAEGCAPSGINNAIRELMAQLKDQQAGTDNDNLTVGGNLIVNGTTTLTGTPTAPTAATATNTTQIATTAFVKASQGTMATQNANAVAITGGSITGITDILVADGGTGVSTLTRNALVVGAGTSAVTAIAPSTNGNVLTSTVGSTVTAGSFVVGTQYTIKTIGTTNFTSIGADSSPAVGEVFTATGVGSGTGTATINLWTSSEVPIDNGSITAPKLSGNQTGTQPIYGVRAFFYVNINNIVASTALVTGQQYAIAVAGTTTWTSAGASSSAVGTIFTATGTAAGTGTAYLVKSQGFSNWRALASYYAQFTFSTASTPPDALYAISSTVGSNGGVLYATEQSRTGSTIFALFTSDDASLNAFSQMSVIVIY